MDETTYRQFRGKWVGSNHVLRVAAIVASVFVVVTGLFSTYYTVAPEEEAVVVRFGRYHTTTPPGLHFKLPFGIDDAIKVPVTEVRKLEFGFRTLRAGVRTQYADAPDDEIKLMLTGDLNIASVEWVVQYRIKDARAWWFNVRDREKTIRDFSEAAMRSVIGDHTITEVLTEKRTEIAAQVKDALQSRLDGYGLAHGETDDEAAAGRFGMGVDIVAVQLQNVKPPGPVQDSWDDVNAAQQERERLENEAQLEYNKVIPLARGKAQATIAEAEGYAIDRVNRAKGDVARFTQLLDVYRESPEVTRQRLFLETVQDVLPNVKRVVVADESGILKMLPIDVAGGGR